MPHSGHDDDGGDGDGDDDGDDADGGLGYGHAKQELFEVMDRFLAEPREKYLELASSPKVVEQCLAEGADRARTVARATMERVRGATGLSLRH